MPYGNILQLPDDKMLHEFSPTRLVHDFPLSWVSLIYLVVLTVVGDGEFTDYRIHAPLILHDTSRLPRIIYTVVSTLLAGVASTPGIEQGRIVHVRTETDTTAE